MNKPASFLLCWLLSPMALLAGSFEGTIRLSMKSPKNDQPTLIDYSMKEGFLRMDITATSGRAKGKNITSILDLNKHEMTTLMPEQKMYMVMKTEDLATAAQNAASSVQIEKTGETEKILGYTAVKYLVTDTNRKTTSDVWAAEGLGTFMMGRSSPFGKNGSLSAIEKEFAARGFFPLRIINHDASGAETFRMEAVSIDKKTLPDDTFAVPADYHRFDMGSMFGGFGEGKPPQN
jgi:nitrogen regulatory protein PII